MDKEIFYVGRNKDEHIVQNSSSGGVMSAVAAWVFEHKGVVFGAVYNKNKKKIEHIRVDKYEDIRSMRKSKYVWSNYTGCLKNLESCLKDGKKVLFIGTPCQTYSIKHLYGDYTNLILLDFYCHGTLEARYFTNYINSIEDDVDSIDFRDEAMSGKHNFLFSITNKHKKKIIQDEYNDNLLTYLFISSAGIRKACIGCRFCTQKHISNITMGDVEYESVAQRHGFEKKHLSIISINDELGNRIFDEIKERLQVAILDDQDEKEIRFHYKEHSDSGKIWEYNSQLRLWFEKEALKYGFIEAAYRCKFFEDIQRLKNYDGYIEKKYIYLYGCGKKGTILKKLIDKYFSHWDICGYIVTKKDIDFKNGLPVFEVSILNSHPQNIFIIVATEERKEIYEILNNMGLAEGKDYE